MVLKLLKFDVGKNFKSLGFLIRKLEFCEVIKLFYLF